VPCRHGIRRVAGAKRSGAPPESKLEAVAHQLHRNNYRLWERYILAESRKVLVPFDSHHPANQSSDFLVPVVGDAGDFQLVGTRSHALARHGMVVLTSRFMSENDLFATMVDGGFKIPSVDETLSLLLRYVQEMDGVKIGNIVQAASRGGVLELVVVAKSPSGFAKPKQ
jgi:hypothetical protein